MISKNVYNIVCKGKMLQSYINSTSSILHNVEEKEHSQKKDTNTINAINF